MPRPPLAQPLFFFSLLLILGGAAGAVGSFWWTARWHDPGAATTEAAPRDGDVSGAEPVREAPLVTDSEWENRPGWKWAVEPMEWRNLQTVATWGGIISFNRGEHGLNVYLARMEAETEIQPRTRYDAVALDAAGERLEAVEMRGNGLWGGVSLRHFEFSEADADSIARVGVEALDRDGWRKVSRAARQEAEAEGIRTLPFPEVGKPYSFRLDLASGDGEVQSADYSGKVLLIDCWASWCGPCVDLIPDLHELRATHRDRGLEILGVNFDLEWKRAEEAIGEHGVAWPQVFAGGSWEAIDLWGNATTIRGIPRFFLVDREGILRWDAMETDPEALTRAVEECLAG
ncbi:MAG TPA: TlpA disulfide reductase family protein [bacterium]|nr:TlpA disulfide reductase family protein [bacterium]